MVGENRLEASSLMEKPDGRLEGKEEHKRKQTSTQTPGLNCSPTANSLLDDNIA